MYCQKCGSKIEDTAIFCCQCGTKVLHNNTNQELLNHSSINTKEENMDIMDSSKSTKFSNNSQSDFKNFVDNYIQTNTKFHSAEELLKKSKPLMFVWICFVVGILIGLIAFQSLTGVLIGIFFGYIAAWIVGIAKRFSFPTHSYDGKIDLDQLVDYLNTYLKYLSPYFCEWEYVDNDTIKCNFNKKIEATIRFSVSSKGKNIFIVGARKKFVWTVFTGSSVSRTNAGFGEYQCMYLTEKIFTATIEYYTKHYKIEK